MALPWRDHPSWAIVEQAEAALGEPLGHLDHRRARRCARRAPAKRSSRCCSPRSSSGTRSHHFPAMPVAFAGHSLGQVTALIASGVLPLDAGVRFAARRAELTQAAADAHPGKMAALLGATPEQADDACTAAPDACWVANDNAPGQVVIAGTPEGVAAGSARAQELGVRRVTAAQRRRRLPHATHGRRHRRVAAEVGRARPGRTRGARSSRTTTRWPTPTPTVGATGCPPHVSVPVRWRSTMDTLVGLGADDVPRGRARLDARCARQAGRARRSPSATSPLPKTSPRSWRSHSPWKPS